MSTRIVVSVPANNHLSARVVVLGLQGNEWVEQNIERVAQGQCIERLVYATQRILIEEVE